MQNKKPTRWIAILAAAILGIVAIIVVILSISRMSGATPGAIKITLETSGGVPYAWSYRVSDESVIEHTGVETKDLDPEMDGGSVEETHSFKALKKGEADIVFEYKDSTDEDEDVIDTKTYHVVVDDKLNIKVEGE